MLRMFLIVLTSGWLTSIYACTRRVCPSVSRNYGSGPDREKRPVHRLPITERKGKGDSNLLQTSLNEGRKRHGRVWRHSTIANRVAIPRFALLILNSLRAHETHIRTLYSLQNSLFRDANFTEICDLMLIP